MKSALKWVCCAAMMWSMNTQSSFADAIADHPAHDDLTRIFKTPAPASFNDSGLTRADYLKLIAANVDFWLKCQDGKGAIIDPVSKGERQYSTPAFAAAAGLLVKEVDRKDLLEPACRAMTCALTALVNKKSADGHSDFYIPLLVHAYRFLKDVAPADKVKEWKELFARVNPETMYNEKLRGMNWNIVSDSGELLRRKDGLVASDRLDAQMKYLEMCLKGHMPTLLPIGLFKDPGAPMAYDAFSRLWLEDVYADDAYTGVQSEKIASFLQQGGLSTLLLISPSGEWISGGRSALHNWTDLEVAAICEMNAARWKKQGRNDVAGAFKRAAHLSFQSAARWQRPSGELNIIKNRAEPEQRLAYEGYSNHSQYNLLPMAMLAIAYSRADESVKEAPMPSEAGTYVFDLRDTFHKVVAAAGGYYVAIDTSGDPHYNGTGLLRVHRAGVLFPALSDNTSNDRAYGPKESPKLAIAAGIQWKVGDKWVGLADFGEGKAKQSVQDAELKIDRDQGSSASFSIVYKLAGEGGDGRVVTEKYTVSGDGVTLTSSVAGDPTDYRVQLPVQVSDGAADLNPKLERDGVEITQDGSSTRIAISGAGVGPLTIEGPRVVNHNGWVERAIAPVQSGSVVIKVTMQQK